MSGKSPSTHAVPQISADALRACYADARARYPEEACGLLSGPRAATQVDTVRVCENQQNRLHQRDPKTHPRDARSAYSLGFRDLQFLDDSLAESSPQRVQIIYHSHCDVGAYFSQEDERAATFEGQLIYPVDYLVIDCQKDGVRGAKLFRFIDGGFVEVAAYGAD
jgi:adenylyltransferase/sulfurtransferase